MRSNEKTIHELLMEILCRLDAIEARIGGTDDYPYLPTGVSMYAVVFDQVPAPVVALYMVQTQTYTTDTFVVTSDGTENTWFNSLGDRVDDERQD